MHDLKKKNLTHIHSHLDWVGMIYVPTIDLGGYQLKRKKHCTNC